MRGRVVMLEGGHDYDGREFMPFDEAGMREAARQIREDGIESVAIAAIFSPLDPSHEERAAAILAEECPGAAITLSHRLGRIGLLERENASLLNAALSRSGARHDRRVPGRDCRERHRRPALSDPERRHRDVGRGRRRRCRS